MKAICKLVTIKIIVNLKGNICFKIRSLTTKIQFFDGILKSNKNHFFYIEFYLLLSNKTHKHLTNATNIRQREINA